jgi:hypothetical protein
MSEQGSGNGWSRYEQQVLYRLGELDRKISELDDKMHNRVAGVSGRILELQRDIDHRVEALDDRMDNRISGVQARINELQTAEIGDLKTEVALLKLKAGVWGAVAGMLPATVLILYQQATGS